MSTTDPWLSGTPEDWPYALRKACNDEFFYAALIEGIGWVEFVSAQQVAPGWVRLIGPEYRTEPHLALLDAPGHFPRGLEIQIAKIVAVADAPSGS